MRSLCRPLLMRLARRKGIETRLVGIGKGTTGSNFEQCKLRMNCTAWRQTLAVVRRLERQTKLSLKPFVFLFISQSLLLIVSLTLLERCIVQNSGSGILARPSFIIAIFPFPGLLECFDKCALDVKPITNNLSEGNTILPDSGVLIADSKVKTEAIERSHGAPLHIGQIQKDPAQSLQIVLLGVINGRQNTRRIESKRVRLALRKLSGIDPLTNDTIAAYKEDILDIHPIKVKQVRVLQGILRMCMSLHVRVPHVDLLLRQRGNRTYERSTTTILAKSRRRLAVQRAAGFISEVFAMRSVLSEQKDGTAVSINDIVCVRAERHTGVLSRRGAQRARRAHMDDGTGALAGREAVGFGSCVGRSDGWRGGGRYYVTYGED